MRTSVKTLLRSVIDYAGLFPPTTLDLQAAMKNYAHSKMAAYRWMLGQFVLPISRFSEFVGLLSNVALEQWSLSLIASTDLQMAIDRVQAFSNSTKIAIAALEFPPLPPAEIKAILPYLPADITPFFEIPLSEDPHPYLTALHGTQAAAKIRTGGTAPAAFPDLPQLCHTIFAFAAARVPFKATAGLHHALPAKRQLTSEPGSPIVAMQGFLNLVLLSAFADGQKITPEAALDLLKAASIDEFKFAETQISWRDRHLSLAELAASRQRCFRSFGSCSFEEPIADLQSMQLL